MFRKEKKKTPRPEVRRLPGQSLREEKERLFNEKLAPYFVVTVFAWVLCLISLLNTEQFSRERMVCLGITVGATGVFAFVFVSSFDQLRRLIRGERGEILVAEKLEDLRASDFRSFHDLVRDGFNVDHIVVGPPGVFVIETKYRSGHGLIEFRNGQGMFIGGWPEEGDSLRQARWNAKTVRELLREETGLQLHVTPLVVFVGDWKINDTWQNTDARVLAAEQIPQYFRERDQPELKGSEIALICSHLRRSVKG